MEQTTVQDRQPLVIYIEDDEEDQQLCRFALESSPMDIDMRFMGDAQTAMDFFDALESNSPDHTQPSLVLIDLNMPVISGWDLLRHIRAKPLLRRMPVVVFTTSNAPHDLHQAYVEGANAYMIKPAGMQALAECFNITMQYWLNIVAMHD